MPCRDRLALAAGACLIAAAVGCGGASPAASTTPAPAAGRPNFVVIITDDMAYGLFGTAKRLPFLTLPNLQGLAAQGVQFNWAFVTTSLCSPSRATILSGLYAHAHGVTANENQELSPDFPTFPQYLQHAGYHTAFVGKWHMDASRDSPRPGFDHWVSFRGQGVYDDPTLNVNGTLVNRTGYITDLLTDYAVDWLNQRAAEPFLLILSHKAPHAPFEPAPRHAGALADASLPEPRNFEDTFTDKPSWQRRYAACGGGVAAFTECPDPLPPDIPVTPWPDRVPWMLNYTRTLLSVDESVGRVLSVLESRGWGRSTYVLFMSDNGFFLGEHRLGDKRVAYEESLRIPMVMRGPGVAPAASNAIVLNLDVAPTLLDLAGIAVPGAMQGRSLARLLHGEATGVRDSFLYEYESDPRIPVVPRILGLRTLNQKYVTYPDRPGEEELYNLDTDEPEMKNLADRPEWAASRADLRQRLERIYRETGGANALHP
jgi:N-acetylglucosamine-6-sulfatase